MTSILNAIGEKLRTIVPDENLKIYKNNVEGGFKTPSFFVQKTGSSDDPLLSDMQSQTYSYQVVFFPTDEAKNADEIEQVERALSDNFTELDNLANVSHREFKVNDNTLNFMFNVTIFVKPEDEFIKASNLNYKGGINHG